MHFYVQITEFRKKCGIGREWKRFGQENAALYSAIESGKSTACAQFHVENVPAGEQRDVEFRNRVAWQIGRHDNISPDFRKDFCLVFVYLVREARLRRCLRSLSPELFIRGLLFPLKLFHLSRNPFFLLLLSLRLLLLFPLFLLFLLLQFFL